MRITVTIYEIWTPDERCEWDGARWMIETPHVVITSQCFYETTPSCVRAANNALVKYLGLTKEQARVIPYTKTDWSNREFLV